MRHWWRAVFSDGTFEVKKMSQEELEVDWGNDIGIVEINHWCETICWVCTGRRLP